MTGRGAGKSLTLSEGGEKEKEITEGGLGKGSQTHDYRRG